MALLLPQYKSIRYFVQDESRFGLKTVEGRKITLQGVKPIGEWQWKFQAFWLYGAVEPLTGEGFFWQFSHVDTECYQQFLQKFSPFYPNTVNILQVDNGLLHQAKRLQLPENLILLFQPPYCPELNPIERVWQHLKKDLKWEIFENLEHLESTVAQLMTQLTPQVLASLTGYDFILQALSIANIF